MKYYWIGIVIILVLVVVFWDAIANIVVYQFSPMDCSCEGICIPEDIRCPQ